MLLHEPVCSLFILSHLSILSLVPVVVEAFFVFLKVGEEQFCQQTLISIDVLLTEPFDFIELVLIEMFVNRFLKVTQSYAEKDTFLHHEIPTLSLNLL